MSKNVNPYQKPEKRNNKRWADIEILQLLKYLQEQQEFEKPTAQIFYRKFLESSGLDATWDLVRWKMKNLRINYKKAKAWRESDEAALLEKENGVILVQEKVRKMCRFYDQLDAVFGQKELKSQFEIFDSATTCSSFNSLEEQMDDYEEYESMDSFSATTFTEAGIVIKEEYECLDVPTLSSVPLLRSPLTPPALTTQPPEVERELHQRNKVTQEFVEKPKKAVTQNTLNQEPLDQNEKNFFLKLRFEFEKEKFKKEFELKEKKFQEEIKERKENYELKKMELEKDERLRIMEMEKQERIERLEIEMRYKSRYKHKD